MKDTVAVRKYARALFAETTAKPGRACQQGLEEMARIIQGSGIPTRDTNAALYFPGGKEKLVHSALGNMLNAAVRTIFDLLVQRRRFDLTPGSLRRFGKRWTCRRMFSF